MELIRLGRDSVRHLRAIYRPEGLNLGMNIGHSAGAGIAGHVHLHVLPRWTGDTNFITTVGETRVVPEELEVTWEKLRARFAASRFERRGRCRAHPGPRVLCYTGYVPKNLTLALDDNLLRAARKAAVEPEHVRQSTGPRFPVAPGPRDGPAGSRAGTPGRNLPD